MKYEWIKCILKQTSKQTKICTRKRTATARIKDVFYYEIANSLESLSYDTAVTLIHPVTSDQRCIKLQQRIRQYLHENITKQKPVMKKIIRYIEAIKQQSHALKIKSCQYSYSTACVLDTGYSKTLRIEYQLFSAAPCKEKKHKRNTSTQCLNKFIFF